MEIDLNMDLPNPDMQEVIINPAAAPGALNGDILELNDLLQEADQVEEVIQPVENPRLNLNDAAVD